MEHLGKLVKHFAELTEEHLVESPCGANSKFIGHLWKLAPQVLSLLCYSEVPTVVIIIKHLFWREM